jgi:putative transposase
MAELFRNKYRISTARLQTWNYADNGMYFITICTANRECFFGDIVNDNNAEHINAGDVNAVNINVETRCIASLPRPLQYKMVLNDLGKKVEVEWSKTSELRPDMNLALGEHVVMPNHFHGIIWIGENQFNTTVYENVLAGETLHTGSGSISNASKNRFGPQSKNLASIIRGFKSAVTSYARINDIAFNWQGRFHEHIIRNNDEYSRIATYIKKNPNNWTDDKFYKSYL